MKKAYASATLLAWSGFGLHLKEHGLLKEKHG